MTTPERLKAWRKLHGLTLVAFGEVVDVPHSLVHEYEKGTRRPSLKTALAIETATGGEIAVEEWGHDGAAMMAVAEARTRRARPPSDPPAEIAEPAVAKAG